MTSDSPHLRMGVLGVVVISLFAALFSRLWFLQVMSAPTLTVAAETNRERVVSIAPVRGRIVDREGRVLADNRLSNVVTVDREYVSDERDKDVLIAHLAPVLGVPVDSLHARIDDPKYSPLLPIPLAEDVPEPTVMHIEEDRTSSPASRRRKWHCACIPTAPRRARARLRRCHQRHRVRVVEGRRLHARRSARQRRRREDLREGPARDAGLVDARSRLSWSRAPRARPAPTRFPAATCS